MSSTCFGCSLENHLPLMYLYFSIFISWFLLSDTFFKKIWHILKGIESKELLWVLSQEWSKKKKKKGKQTSAFQSFLVLWAGVGLSGYSRISGFKNVLRCILSVILHLSRFKLEPCPTHTSIKHVTGRPFLLFIGKEQSKMAAPRGAQLCSKTKKKREKNFFYIFAVDPLYAKDTSDLKLLLCNSTTPYHGNGFSGVADNEICGRNIYTVCFHDLLVLFYISFFCCKMLASKAQQNSAKSLVCFWMSVESLKILLVAWNCSFCSCSLLQLIMPKVWILCLNFFFF